jgi:hypothetical protein
MPLPARSVGMECSPQRPTETYAMTLNDWSDFKLLLDQLHLHPIQSGLDTFELLLDYWKSSSHTVFTYKNIRMEKYDVCTHCARMVLGA